ncbi:hypothetical protein BDD43_0499 [Mucilaginibacter gracilis]|uniref:Uncharacterized protein n=1 Tax=Mucilaginibacter gracilis TaxID=423350 RepID=A0A495IWJ5_9SPHI|nr:hypothetical protein [Mucilaginibacter gracilis]RKR80394.1 hypothetical protein BDD43_0499 [Mucilaginibacter gracilis]
MKLISKVYLLLLVLLCFFALTCKKSPDPATTFFNGTARIKGAIYVRNFFTNTDDSAKAVTVTFYKSGNPAVKYVRQLTDGSFDISGLTGGDYFADAQYNFKPAAATKGILFKAHQPFTLADGEFNPELDIRLLPDSTATPTLQLLVKDAKGGAISNAQVCLYADVNSLAANRGTCGGSLKNGTTNSSGIVVFEGLQQISYYASVSFSNGNTILSNSVNDIRAIKIASTSKLNIDSISLTPQGNSLTLLVQDQGNANVVGANVCLYSDATLLVKYRGKCTGSLMNGVTNGQGLITFSGLQNIPYYASVYQLAGTDTLSNKGNDLSNPITPQAGTLVTITIKLVKQVPVVSTSLRVTVTDAFLGLMANTSVCLYTDTTLLVKYRGQCSGSLKSGVTDVNGILTFDNLQPITYYLSAYKVAGKDSLNNKGTDTGTPVKLSANTLKDITVIIKK